MKLILITMMMFFIQSCSQLKKGRLIMLGQLKIILLTAKLMLIVLQGNIKLLNIREQV